MIKPQAAKHLFLIIIFSIYGAAFILLEQTRVMFVDERLHIAQILSLARGDYSQNPYLLMFPGFHLVISLAVRLFHTDSIYFLRMVSFSLSILMIYIYYRTVQIVDLNNAFIKSSLLIFLPVLFPYLFLLYTDGFSLLTVLLTYYLILKKKYFFSGITGTYSLFVRQNNLFFILFIIFIRYIQNYGWKIDKAGIISYLKKNRILLSGMFIFTVFVVLSEKLLNGTYVRNNVAFSVSSFTNIFYGLFVSFWLFLPLHLANLKKIIQLLNKKPVIIIIFAGFCLFLISFMPNHPYNRETWFLHNSIFHYFSAELIRKVLFYFAGVIAALSFTVTGLIRKEYYFIYPAAILYLLPLKMIEFRYYILPIAFFLLFMKKERGSGMVATGIIFICISLYFLWGMLTGSFFP